MTELTDAEARILIAERTDETLFVEAGAGTGKTTELVNRILALVGEGVPIASIAAITFTEKAAAELSERVRRRLEEQASASSGARRELFTKAVDELDQASLQTLHSFAMRILGLYPLEAGLPPRIALRDDVQAALAFRERWDGFLDGLLDDPALERPLLRGLTVGLRLKDLEQVAGTFNENWDRMAALAIPRADEPELDAAGVLEPLEAVQAMRQPWVNDGLTRRLDSVAGLMEILRELQPALRGADREKAEVDLLRVLAKTPELTRSVSGKPNIGDRRNWDDLEAARGCVLEAERERRRMVDGVRAAVICELLPHLRDFVLECAAERRKQGTLEFHDLLVLARDLLRENAGVRASLHARYARILIDEFQDTDPIQVELAALLATTGAGTGPWQEMEAEAGRLFFVGDPKQSIYRFRRADIELFKQARSGFDARLVTLRKNFRCRPAILEWVNEVCGELFLAFGAGADERQADWIPLEAGVAEGKGAAVHLLGGPRPLLAAGIRNQEAEAIAATVLAAKQENWLGRDHGRGKTTNYSDIAILLPTRTNSASIERALADAGVPTRVESRSLLFAAQEIRDLTNILAAMDDPTDDVAIVAALRAPAFAVRDDELLAHALAGGRWDYTREQPAESPEPVREGMAALKAFHDARWGTSIGALVERVVAERKMLELAIAAPRPREIWRRLRFVSEQARSLGDSSTVTSLRQFVQWLRTQAEENTRIAETVANEPDDDAVKILTIHAAKGLEFPIVILAGLGIAPRNIAPRVAWGRTERGQETVAVHVGRMGSYFDTPGFEAFKENEGDHEWLQRDRLFYVAATRAKDRLVVSLFHKEQQKQSHEYRHASRTCALAECVQALRMKHPEWVTLQHGMPLGPGVSLAAPVEETEAQRSAWVAERANRIERLGRAPVVAATTIAHPAEEEPAEEEQDPAVDDQPWRKGRAGTSVGRAVHAVLQTVDLTTGTGIAETARSQAVAEGIADQAARIARLAENARNSEAVHQALRSGRMWRELYVGAPIDGTLVEGFIDLLYEGPDGLVVVDYKTDSARDPEAIDRAMARYRLQGAAYALVLEQALGRPVAECVFVFTEPKQERVVDDLEGAKAAVVEEIRRRSATLAGR